MGGTRSSGSTGRGTSASASGPSTGGAFAIGSGRSGSAPPPSDEDREFEVEYVLGGQLYRTNELFARNAEDAVKILQDPSEAQNILSNVARNLVNPDETFGLGEGQARLIPDPSKRSPKADYL